MGDSVERIERERFAGMRVRLEPLSPTVTVATTPTQILPRNPNRIAFVVVNKTTNPGHVDFENTVSTTQGFPLTQNGGSFQMHVKDDGGTVQSDLWGIIETAAGTVYRRAWEVY